jgi:hypothetical protein
MKNKRKRIIEELLQENELDITYISAVATVITETILIPTHTYYSSVRIQS